jgi:plasmid stabilization system protein ParE
MRHRRTPQADSDLDDIWNYVATKSCSLDIADRFIESITDRILLLAVPKKTRTC